MRKTYVDQVDLLLDVLPHAMKDKRFALKGGTAINLFYRDMPRLSVDIDLCYLPVEDRSTSFKNIHSILDTIKADLERLGFQVKPSKPLNGKSEVKLFVGSRNAEIKVEPNFTLRGSVFEPKTMTTKAAVIKEFGKEVDANCLSLADLFGGKICAALDRQHPRDLFDIKYFLEKEGFTDEVRKSFIVYLISHSRPMNKIINPNLKDLSTVFTDEFHGMTTIEVTLDELIHARVDLINAVQANLTVHEKDFLLSLKDLNPKWNLLGLKGIDELPAVKWKLLNLKKMDEKKRKTKRQLLEESLIG